MNIFSHKQTYMVKRLPLFIFFLPVFFSSCSKISKKESTSKDEWFINQRIFPQGAPDYSAYKKAVAWRQENNSMMREMGQQAWQYAGPENLGGRVTDVEMPSN